MLFKRFLYFLQLVMTLFLFYVEVAGQSIHPERQLLLKRKKKTVRVYANDYFGFTTAIDTVPYFVDQELGYQLVAIDSLTLLLRRPLLYRDTILEEGSREHPPARAYIDGRTGFTKNKTDYRRLVMVDSFAYRSLQIAAITSIHYPPDAGNYMSCMWCSFLPIINLFWWKSLKKRTNPEYFPIGPWRLEAVIIPPDTVRPVQPSWIDKLLAPK